MLLLVSRQNLEFPAKNAFERLDTAPVERLSRLLRTNSDVLPRNLHTELRTSGLENSKRTNATQIHLISFFVSGVLDQEERSSCAHGGHLPLHKRSAVSGTACPSYGGELHFD